MKINSMLAATLAFVLVAGLGTPAFAGTDPFEGEENAVWVNCFVIIGESGDCSTEFGSSTFSTAPFDATWSCETLNNMATNNGLVADCVVIVPNYIDPLPLKLIHITTDFAEVVGIACFDDDGSNGVKIKDGTRDSQVPNDEGFIEEWRCEPNPDFEDIFFILTNNEVSNIEIHTVSKDVPPTPTPPKVGGELLPIDSTTLVLAGLQTSAIWMLPVLAGVAGSAFGILYIKSRRN